MPSAIQTTHSNPKRHVGQRLPSRKSVITRSYSKVLPIDVDIGFIKRAGLSTLAAGLLLFANPSDVPRAESSSLLSPEDERIADVYDRVNPSVVNIFDAAMTGRGPVGSNSPGNGSGIIYSREGYIVTNYHVLGKLIDSVGIEKAKSLTTPISKVLILDKNELQESFDGYFVAADKPRDLLVLKVNAPPEILQPATFGDSSATRVGQSILSIGNPFGFEHSMSKGIISAKNRGFQSYTDSVIGGALQIDAATNPGNSGGPVISASTGEVIGVNAAIFTNTGDSVRVGFAIPSNTVKNVVDQLIANGQVIRPSIGITPAPATIAKSLGTITDGVMIQTVQPNGPSDGKLFGTRREITGVRRGDIIIKLNDSIIHNIFDLSSALDQLSIGDSVAVTVLGTGGEPRTETITLAHE
ncbi:hypothetical protein M9434_003869 [Picochlorum sp. BPE23]|nr:hypothetical protein M9434_003869 [Picochlorum sp. BPE23]